MISTAILLFVLRGWLLLEDLSRVLIALIKGRPHDSCSLSLVPSLQIDHTMSTIESISQPLPTTDVNPAPASGQANGATALSSPPTAIEGFDRWVKDFQKYESIMVRLRSYYFFNLEIWSVSQGEMAKASADTKFKDELATIEHCEPW